MSDKQTTMTDDEFVKMFCYIMEKTNKSLNKEKKIECECGCFVTKSYMTRHKKTEKHYRKSARNSKN